MEVGQAIDIRALEGARHLFGQAIRLHEDRSGLSPRNDGEAVDVEEVAAAAEAEDARSSAGTAGLGGAGAGVDAEVADAELGIVGPGGAGIGLGEIEGPLIIDRDAACQDLSAGGPSGRSGQGECSESEQALFHL